ncbi:hypothetical protein GCM10027059_39580 [Myceligenerans halotolerans]
MTENPPRDPDDPRDPEPDAPGTDDAEQRPTSDRPAEPRQPAEPASETPSSAEPPAGATPAAAPPSGGYGASPHGRHSASSPEGAEGSRAGAAGAEPAGGPGVQPGGGFGAPPPGGEGTPPPYGGGGPAGGGAGVPTGSFRVGEALGYGWGKFAGNALVWILFALLLLVVGIVFNTGNATSYQDVWDAGRASAEIDTGGSLLGLIGAVLVGILQGLGTNAALSEVSGRKPTFASLFRAPNLGMIVVAALLLMAAQFVGVLLCLIGLPVVLVFAVFTYQGVIDKNQNAWEAFIASFKLVGQNFGAVFLLELALFGINILGLIPCGLGLLVTIPLSYIALSFAYRRLTGGPVMA